MSQRKGSTSKQVIIDVTEENEQGSAGAATRKLVSNCGESIPTGQSLSSAKNENDVNEQAARDEPRSQIGKPSTATR